MANNETIYRGEQECYNYLLKITGAVDGRSAFLGELPPMHEAYMFGISGGPDPSYADGAKSCTWGSWIVAGELVGNYKERKDAQLIWGALLDGLPAGLNVQNADDFNRVQTFRLDSQPSLTVEYLRMANGGDDNVYRVWQLRADFQIVLNSVT